MAKSDAQAFVDSHRDEGTTELFGITELCREFGISRKTGYKILERYQEYGLEALSDRPRCTMAIDAALDCHFKRRLNFRNLERAKGFEPSTPTLANRTGHFPLRTLTCAHVR